MIFKNPREKGKMPKSCRDKMMQITYGRTQVTVIDVNLRARQPGYEPQPLFPNCKTLLTLLLTAAPLSVSNSNPQRQRAHRPLPKPPAALGRCARPCPIN